MIIKRVKLKCEEILSLLMRADSIFQPHPLSDKIDLYNYAQKLSTLATHIAAFENSNLIGMTCFYMNNKKTKTSFISVTCIDPDFIGCGLGQQLTIACETYVRGNDYICVEFEVDKENLPSIKMHEKIGYSINRENSKTSYIMRKQLKTYSKKKE